MKPDFAQIYEEYYPQILSYLRKRVSVEAEDLAQETFTRALENYSSFDPGASNLSKNPLKTWLFTIAKNVAVDYYRGMKRQPLPLEVIREHGSSDGSNGAGYGYIETRVDFDNAVRSLTPMQREVVTLLASGAERKDIRLELGISDGSLRFAIHHARQRLKVSNCLEGRV